MLQFQGELSTCKLTIRAYCCRARYHTRRSDWRGWARTAVTIGGRQGWRETVTFNVDTSASELTAFDKNMVQTITSRIAGASPSADAHTRANEDDSAITQVAKVTPYLRYADHDRSYLTATLSCNDSSV